MKRLVFFGLSVTLVSIFMTALAFAQADAASQPLGDYAKKVKKQQAQKPPATKHFDNDNLPKDDHLSVVGPTPEPSNDAAAKPGDGGPDATDKSAEKPAASASSTDDKQADYADWQKRINDQKAAIDLSSRELDVLQREYRMRAAAVYADVGNRLRNSAQWDKEDADYKQKIADKQKAVEDAKQKLDDMQEQARKAGVPSSFRE
jgi:hypothetical protein